MMKTFAARMLAVGLIAACAVLLMASPGRAAAQNVAKVNIRKVAEKHPVYVQWMQDTAEMRKERQAAIDANIKKEFNLPDNPEEAQLTEEQQMQIQQYLYSENQRFLDEMEPIREQKLMEVENDIIAKVETVAKARGFELVLDSSVVLLGGTDITDDVITAIGGQ